MRKPRAREGATYDERINILDKKWMKARKRLPYHKTTAKHWWITAKSPNWITRKQPLYKIYHGEPIKMVEYRYLINYFKRQGLTFSYPIEKIKFIDEQNRSNTSEIPADS